MLFAVWADAIIRRSTLLNFDKGVLLSVRVGACSLSFLIGDCV